MGAQVVAGLCLALSICSAGAGTVDPLQTPSPAASQAVHLMRFGIATAGKRLVTVGERGTVQLSDDNGRNWRLIQTPVSVTLTRVFFADASRGWAVGHSGVILGSTDGGESWLLQLDGKRAAAIEQEAASATGDRRRMAQSQQLVADGSDKPWLDVRFFDARHGMVVGAFGTALSTEDGGKHWQSMVGRLPNVGGRHWYSVRQIGNRIYIGGEQGNLVFSDDQGKSFTVIDTPSKATFFTLVEGPQNSLIAFGLRGLALRTADGGKSWSKLAIPSRLTFSASTQAGVGESVVADESGLLLVSRDGVNFAPVSMERSGSVADIAFAADGSVVAVGPAGAVHVELDPKAMEKAK